MPKQRLFNRCLWGGLVLWMLSQWAAIVSVHVTDFDHYYTAGQRLLAGENVYYDARAAWVRGEIGTWYLYPPYFAGMIAPLTFIGIFKARIVFTLFSFAALIAVDWLLVRIIRRLTAQAEKLEPLVHVLTFFAFPTYPLLHSLQVEGMIFLLLLITLAGAMEKHRGWYLSLPYIVGVLIKLWPAPYLLSLMAVERRRLWLPLTVGTVGIVGFMTAFVGAVPQWYYIRYVLPDLLSYVDPYKDNQSLARFIQLNLPAISAVMPWLKIGLVAVYVCVTYRIRESLFARNGLSLAVNAGLFVCLTVLLSPTIWTAAHIRLLLPIVVACAVWIEREKKAWWLALATLFSIALYTCTPDFPLPEVLSIVKRFPLLFSTLIQFSVFTFLSFRLPIKNGAE